MSTFTKGQLITRVGPDHNPAPWGSAPGVKQGETYTVSWAEGVAVTLKGHGDYTYDADRFEPVVHTSRADDTHAPGTCAHGTTAEDLCNAMPDKVELDAMWTAWKSLTPAEQRGWLEGGEGKVPTPAKIQLVTSLTAHQPAPEPGPEWKPGTVAKATVRGIAGVQVMRLHPDPEPTEDDPSWVSVDLVDRKGKPLNGWDGKFVHNAVDVTDVRPLVVIDPAAVDVDALAQVVRKAADTSPHIWYMPEIVRAVLAELGIEAP